MSRRTKADKERAARKRRQKAKQKKAKEAKNKPQTGWGQVRVDLTKVAWLTMLAVGIEVLLWYLIKN